ncbi:hypothetical protein CKALI_08180 [Corynebacterium kalinowskii]|uniref:DUF1648 domain-containing protein n=1 Tax=Corynebacterium kalinowskii TaxID=2675216 RepID=A0A6B8VUU5_9CORY|nr:DUF1648 domain-containing protein [Corynebacterium kalinowskii]QGU02496.1 hypothetical protein CKALI_08180 [Corynebacterium kalinowskii]
MTFELIFIALMNALVFWSGTLLTRLAPRTTAFGYRVSEDFDRRAVFRPFTRALELAAVAAFILTLALDIGAGALLGLLALPLTLFLWFHGRSKVRPQEFHGEPTGSVTDDAENLIEVPPVSLLGYWLGLLVIAVTAAYVAARWANIPERFATHFSGNWEPDAWSDKSVLGVFGLTFLNFGLLVLMAGSVLPFLKLKIYARTDPSEAGKKATGAVISAAATALGWFTCALVVCLSLMQLSIVLPAWQSAGTLALIGTLAASIGGTIGMIAYIMVKADKARGGLRPQFNYRDDDQFYKGGMFYNNPNDPARVVDKRDGLGVDFNYAHAPGKIFAVAVVVLLVAPLLLLFL